MLWSGALARDGRDYIDISSGSVACLLACPALVLLPIRCQAMHSTCSLVEVVFNWRLQWQVRCSAGIPLGQTAQGLHMYSFPAYLGPLYLGVEKCIGLV
jgi:hypothetical protein